MNIKSLLLGSAAALVAVSGARAADAVVIAEPEPVEYVRVCDTYGAGFFYIPGTETCLRVGGYMQYDIGVGSLGHEDVLDKESLRDALDTGDIDDLDENDTYYKNARVSLQFDVRSETELGTLRGYAETRFNYGTTTEDVFLPDDDNPLTSEFLGVITTTQNAINLEQGYIELGGFRVGKAATLFESGTFAAGNVVNDDLVDYGTFKTLQIAYTFTGPNGFSASLALEEGDGDLYTLDDYVPHVVAAASFTQGWGAVSAVVGYDAVWEEWAGKVRLDLNATDALTFFVMAGYKSGADESELGGFDTPNNYGRWVGDWAVWGGGSWQATEKAQINAQLSYSNGNDAQGDEYAAVLNVDYELVENLRIIPEIAYTSTENLFDDDDREDDFGGWLRIRRSF